MYCKMVKNACMENKCKVYYFLSTYARYGNRYVHGFHYYFREMSLITCQIKKTVTIPIKLSMIPRALDHKILGGAWTSAYHWQYRQSLLRKLTGISERQENKMHSVVMVD